MTDKKEIKVVEKKKSNHFNPNPSKYQTHVKPKLEEIKHWTREGLTEKEISVRLGISPVTFSRYKKDNMELIKVLVEGKAIADYRVEDALYKRALGYRTNEVTYEKKLNKKTGEMEVVATKLIEKDVAPDTTAMIWWLKNRKPASWKDRQDINLEGSLDIETKYSHLSDEDLEKEVSKMIKVLENE